MPRLDDHRSRGVRALVLLHERHLRTFLATWREAQAAGVTFRAPDDPDYASIEALLRHVLRAARGYLVWTCEHLGLPDPDVERTPETDAIAAEAERHLEQILAAWRTSLRDLGDDRLNEIYASRWRVEYCIDAMLEHAVMHPIRHEFQLRETMAG